MNHCSTRQNSYSTCSTLFTRIILHRVATPATWCDLVTLFSKQPSQLSEIFSEGFHCFWRHRQYLIYKGDLSSPFFASRHAIYCGAIERKCRVLSRCIGFIGRIVLGISPPSDHEEQHAAYNGHKRKHALKFQTVKKLDGITIHAMK